MPLYGTIDSISKNDSAVCNDGDWSLWVSPDEHSTYLTFNSEGTINTDPRTGIELEINTPLELSQYFPAGNAVEASGWWVEDHGHSNKTELHPIIYLKSGTYDKFNLYVGQDLSGRFDVSSWDVSEWFSFNLDSDVGFLDLGADPSSWPTSSTSVLEHTAMLDYVALPMDSAQTGLSDASYIIGPLSSQIDMQVHLKPPLWTVLGVGFYEFPLMLVRPFFLGQFTRSNAQLFSDNVDVRVLSIVGGGKAIMANVMATLANPQQGQLAHSEWQYEETSAIGRTIVTQKHLDANHQVQFQLIYAPGEGFTDNSWDLGVVGTTQPMTWNPGERRPIYAGIGSEQKIVFAGERRRYFVHPSELKLHEDPIVLLIPAPGVGNGLIPCKKGAKLRAEYLPAHPAVALTSQKWQIEFLKNQNGLTLANPQLTDLAPGSTATQYGVTVSVDASNVMSVLFDATGTTLLTSSEGWVGYSFGNSAMVRVIAQGTTELGELPTSETVVSITGCTAHINATTFEDAHLLILKGLLALGKLNELGLPIPQPGPLPPSPAWPPAQLLQVWPRQADAFEAPYELYKRLSEGGRVILKSFERFSNGDQITRADLEAVLHLIRLGASLPEVRLITPKSKVRQIDKLRASSKLLARGMRRVVDVPRVISRGAVFTMEVQFGAAPVLSAPLVRALAQSIAWLRGNSKATVRVSVISPVGTSLEVSKARAEAVRRSLVSTGIDDRYFAILSRVETNQTKGGRVEITVP